MNNNWKKIEPSHLKNFLVEAQLRALQQSPSVLPAIIASVTAFVRAHIKANRNNYIDSKSNTIPPELELPACHLIIEALQSRIPTFKLSPDQVRNANNARIILLQIAYAKFPLSPPIKNLITKLHSKSRKSTATNQTLKGL